MRNPYPPRVTYTFRQLPVRNAAAVAVENRLLASVQQPVVIRREQFPGSPQVPALALCARNKRFLYEHVDHVQAVWRRVRLEAVDHPLPRLCGQILKRTAAENDVIHSFRFIIRHIRPEKIHLHTDSLRQLPGFFHAGPGNVECRDRVTVARKEHRIFSFAAADIQHAVRPHGRTQLHDFIAEVIWVQSPVKAVLLISRLVLGQTLRRIAEQCVDGRLEGGGQRRQHRDIRQRCPVFPFGNGLKRDVQAVRQFLLGKPQRFALLRDKPTDLTVIHRCTPFPAAFDFCLKHSAVPTKKQ